MQRPEEWARRWWQYDLPWYVGRFAKWRGTVRIDSGWCDVSSPRISRFSAGLLALGRYENKEREAIRRFLDPDLPIVECGGAIGIIACVANTRLRHPDQHIVIEASPSLIPILIRNRDLNGCQFSVVHGAVAYGVTSVSFQEAGDELVVGKIAEAATSAAATVTVPAVTLTELLTARGWGACTLICDIEGAEVELFQHEREVVDQTIRWIMLETHRDHAGVDSFDKIFPWLRDREFQHVWSSGDMHVFRAAAGGGK